MGFNYLDSLPVATLGEIEDQYCLHLYRLIRCPESPGAGVRNQLE